MSSIDNARYPLFTRMAGALFQGLDRTFTSERQLPEFLLDFFRENEIGALLVELREILSMKLDDAEWERYWYSSPASSFPADAKSSDRLVRAVIEEILERQNRSPK